MQPPRMPGSGGEVRTYYFLDRLTDLGEITLASLGGGDGMGRVDSRIAARCRRVIQPCDIKPEASPARERPSRLAAWIRVLGVVLCPWRHEWRDFLSFCVQYCPPRTNLAPADRKRSREILAALLRTEMNAASRFFQLSPLQVFHFSHAFGTIERELLEILDAERFDLIWFEHSFIFPFMKSLLPKTGDAPLICNAHNVESLLQQRLATLATNNSEKRFQNTQVRLMRNLETDAFQTSDLVFVCSEQDKRIAERMAPETDFCVVGNGVDTEYFQPANGAGPVGTPTLLFTGGFTYGPNGDALKHFVDKIFPIIIKNRPDCQFVFAGFDAQRAFEQNAITDHRIRCVSSPEDIRPCFHEATVYVVPLRIGGGTRLKVLEAMAMEVPVVSTSIGAEGIPCEPGKHLLLADSPQEFAERVLQLLDDNNLRSRLAHDAGNWVRQHYDWKQLCELAVQRLSSLLEDISDNLKTDLENDLNTETLSKH